MDKRNNKAQFALTGMMVIAFVVFVSVIAFIVSPELRFTMIGGAVIAGAFVYAIGPSFAGDLTNRKIGGILVIIAVGIFIIFIPELGFLEMAQLQTGYFEAPFFATVKCDLAPGSKISGGLIDIDNGRYFSCPSNSKDCDININYPDTGISTGRQIKYKVCDGNDIGCGQYQYYPTSSGSINNNGEYINLYDDLPRNKLIYVEAQKCGLICAGHETGWDSVDDGAEVEIYYNPYILWVQNSLEGGLNPITDSTDCVIPKSNQKWFERIISSTAKSINGQSADTWDLSINFLEPDEAYNFIAGTVTRADFGNLIDYNGQDGYCAENVQGSNKAIIYPLKTLETASNIYRIVDTSEELGREDCCVEGRIQLDRVCQDFKWETITIDTDTDCSDISCGLGNQCNPGKFILDEDDTTSFEWKCESNLCCVRNIQVEECVRNEDCGTNEVCTNFKCMSAGTIPDAKQKDKEPITKEDCESQNIGDSKRFQYTEKETESGFWIFKKKTIEPLCKDTYKPYFYLGAILGTIIIISSVAIVTNKKKKKKGRKKK